MKRTSIKKIMALTIIGTTILTALPIGASAEWRQDSTGWWWTQGNSYATGWFEDKNGKWYYFGQDGYMKTGWEQDNGKWYYLNNDGSMATNTIVDGGNKVDNNGVWIQNITNNINSNNVNTSNNTTNNANSNNTTNVSNNVNNGIIINGNVNIGNTTNNSNSNNNINNTSVVDNNNINTTSKNNIKDANNKSNSIISTTYNKKDNPYTNRTIAKKQNFDGTNGFKQVGDNKYVYYENGIMLNNCWKEFDDGIRYFDENGYMTCNGSQDDIYLSSDGTIQLVTNKQLGKEENKRWYSGTVSTNLVEDFRNNDYSLEYIKYMCDLFSIPIKTQYEDVYNKNEDGKILNVYKKYGQGVMYERSECESITIYIGKYTSRLNLN